MVGIEAKVRFCNRYVGQKLRPKYSITLTIVFSIILEIVFGFIFKIGFKEIILFSIFHITVQVIEIALISVLYEYHYFDQFFIKDIDAFLEDESFD